MEKKYFNAIILFILVAISFSMKLSEPKYSLKIENFGRLNEYNRPWLISTILSNNTDDTITYFIKSCSWQDIYSVNNPKLEIWVTPCRGNVPSSTILLPKESKRVNLELNLIRLADSTSTIKFKIGINIKEIKKGADNKEYSPDTPDNIIWSNEIKL